MAEEANMKIEQKFGSPLGKVRRADDLHKQVSSLKLQVAAVRTRVADLGAALADAEAMITRIESLQLFERTVFAWPSSEPARTVAALAKLIEN
jgi:hypothetical protein